MQARCLVSGDQEVPHKRLWLTLVRVLPSIDPDEHITPVDNLGREPFLKKGSDRGLSLSPGSIKSDAERFFRWGIADYLGESIGYRRVLQPVFFRCARPPAQKFERTGRG